MNVLVIGSGGREHALVWKLRQSPKVERLFCAPGNAGISTQAECVPIRANDIPALADFAKKHYVTLTVVGPEQPLIEGIVDRFEEEGLAIFGPSRAAAELEGSKVFAKRFMQKYNIPTAQFQTFTLAERFQARRFADELPPPIVVKADGLAAGKGVIICETKDEALSAIDVMMEEKTFGAAGERIVVEEFLEGEEMSVFAVTDGNRFVLLPPAQDHKRILDGDRGKNTGGMGAYAPAPIGTEETLSIVRDQIVAPTIGGMAAEGRPYKGCLYVGLMITQTGPKVLEYNCRFGDPETQAVVPLMESDAVDLLLAAAVGDLSGVTISQKNATAVCVVMASGGYPDAYEVGRTISGLNEGFEMDVIIFHAGTKTEKDAIVTAGGRVLSVTALGPAGDLGATVDKAYRAVRKITFDGAYYRSDIGMKGIQRMKELIQ